MLKTRKGIAITLLSMVIFLLFIYYEITQGVKEYIPDTILFMVLLAVACILYTKLNLDTPTYLSIIIALLLHNAGAFGWYNVSPIGLQWDHITHIAAGITFALMFSRVLLPQIHARKKALPIILIIFAAMGAGVLIEFYEFSGYYIVGEGMGGLGHGAGDISTELGNSEWLNTMLDLIFNLVGILLALITVIPQWHHRNP